MGSAGGLSGPKSSKEKCAGPSRTRSSLPGSSLTPSLTPSPGPTGPTWRTNGFTNMTKRSTGGRHPLAKYTFERETRTPQSETFIIEADGDEVGRVDLHYSGTSCYATLNVPSEFDDDAIE